MRLLPALCLAGATLPLAAFGQSADLRLASVTEGLVITQTTSPRLTLTVLNDGPDPTGGVVVRSQGPVPLDQLEVSSPNGCIATTGPTELAWFVGVLEAGQSAECTISLRALSAAIAGALRLSFHSTGLVADPNSFNNTISHLYSLSAFEISVDASVTATLDPPGPIANGVNRRLLVTLRNGGSDAAASIKATSSPVPRGITGGDPFVLTAAPGSPCATFNEDLGLMTLVDVFPLAGLAADGSVVCLLDVRPSASVASRSDVTFTASVAGIGVVDSDRSNDQSVVTIQVGSSPFAVYGPGWKALLLAVLMLLATGLNATRPSARANRDRPPTTPPARTPAPA